VEAICRQHELHINSQNDKQRKMSLGFKPQRALVLAPHTDDGEFGCGGTIARFLEEGVEIFYVAFSICEESVPQGFEKDAFSAGSSRGDEHSRNPGEESHHMLLSRAPVPEHRQDILEDLIRIRGQLSPDLVFLPCSQDIHQIIRSLLPKVCAPSKPPPC